VLEVKLLHAEYGLHNTVALKGKNFLSAVNLSLNKILKMLNLDNKILYTA
jgi:hypothetical protein